MEKFFVIQNIDGFFYSENSGWVKSPHHKQCWRGSELEAENIIREITDPDDTEMWEATEYHTGIQPYSRISDEGVRLLSLIPEMLFTSKAVNDAKEARQRIIAAHGNLITNYPWF